MPVVDSGEGTPVRIKSIDPSISIGGGTQYAAGTTFSATDTVTMAGVVQKAADAGLVADGDVSALQVDANGYLKVNIKAGAGSGGTASADNSAFTGGATNLTPMGAIYDTTPPAITDGNVGTPRMNTNRDLHSFPVDGTGASMTDDVNHALQVNMVAGTISAVTVDNGAGAAAVNIQDGGNTITVDGAVTVSGVVAAQQSGVWNVTINAALPAGTNNIGDVDVLSLPALPAGNNNIGDVDVASLPALPAGNNNIGDVDIASIAAGDNNIGNVDVVTLPALPAGTNNIGDVDVATTNGQSAHDAPIAGNPIRIAGRAGNADYTAVANGDTADILTDLNGRQVVAPYTLPENLISGVTAAITTATNASVIVAGSGVLRNYITTLMATNSHASTGALVTFTDGSGGTALYRGWAAPNGGGFAVTLPTPLRGGVTTATFVTTDSAANVYASASGYRGI